MLSFVDEKTMAQRGKLTCPRKHSWKVVVLGLISDSHIHSLYMAAGYSLGVQIGNHRLGQGGPVSSSVSGCRSGGWAIVLGPPVWFLLYMDRKPIIIITIIII